jgi:hypothetical protein
VCANAIDLLARPQREDCSKSFVLANGSLVTTALK